MAAVISSSEEVILTAAGETVVSAEETPVLSYAATGQTQSSQYGIELVNPAGELLADLSPLCKSRHFVVRRNRAEVVDIAFDQGQLENLCTTLGTSVRGLLAPGVNEIRIKRGNRYLIGAQCQFLQASLEGDSRTIELRAVGFLDLFKDRFLYASDSVLTQTAVDIGQVAWNFIDASQDRTNGNFGITLGTIQTSRNITEDWQPYATSIRDILIALTQREGSSGQGSIDFAFSHDKVFNAYFPGIGQTKSELRFTYPGNIKSLKLPIDASELANTVFNRGSGNGDQQTIVTTSETESQAIYKLREVIDDYPAISVTDTLIEKGNARLRKNANPTTIPEIVLDGNQEPYLGAYWIGDSVPLAIDAKAGSAFAPLDGQVWRINEVDVTLDENDSETIRLKVGLS